MKKNTKTTEFILNKDLTGIMIKKSDASCDICGKRGSFILDCSDTYEGKDIWICVHCIKGLNKLV